MSSLQTGGMSSPGFPTQAKDSAVTWQSLTRLFERTRYTQLTTQPGKQGLPSEDVPLNLLSMSNEWSLRSSKGDYDTMTSRNH